MIYQYEMWFTNEYVEEVVEVFAGILNLKYDEKDVEIAMEEISMYDIKNLLLIKGDGCMLCVDCNYDDYIVPLVVICQEKAADEIRTAMFEWDNKIRKEYGQEPRKEVMNVFYKDNRTLLRRIEEFYKISIHDEYLMYK